MWLSLVKCSLSLLVYFSLSKGACKQSHMVLKSAIANHHQSPQVLLQGVHLYINIILLKRSIVRISESSIQNYFNAILTSHPGSFNVLRLYFYILVHTALKR